MLRAAAQRSAPLLLAILGPGKLEIP